MCTCISREISNLDHIFHLKSCNTLLMLVVLFCFFQKLLRRTTALVNWADQHQKGRAVEVLVMEAMSSEESCYEDNGGNTSKVTKNSVHRLQWESRRMKKIKIRLDKAKKSSPQELKRESYPGLLGNLLLDAHLLKFSRVGNNAEKKFFFLIN